MTEAATADEERLLHEWLARLGGKGSRLVARFLRTEVHERTSVEPLSVNDAGDVLLRELAAGGHVLSHEVAADGSRRICGATGSGGMNLNPTVITIWIAPEPVHGCNVRIRAAAKEGLINQKTSRKAVERLRQALTR